MAFSLQISLDEDYLQPTKLEFMELQGMASNKMLKRKMEMFQETVPYSETMPQNLSWRSSLLGKQ